MKKRLLTNLKTKVASASAAVMTITAPVVVRATSTFQEYKGMTANSIVDGFFAVIGAIGTFGGAMYVGGAALALAMALRTEDTEARNKAIHNLMGGIALLSVGGIILLFKVKG